MTIQQENTTEKSQIKIDKKNKSDALKTKNLHTKSNGFTREEMKKKKVFKLSNIFVFQT